MPDSITIDTTRRHDFVLLFDVRDGNPTATPMPVTCPVSIPRRCRAS